MLRSFLTRFSLLIMATALASCCGSTACECKDAYADAVGLKFDLKGSADSKAFLGQEIDTVYLVRVPRDTAQKPRADTLQLVLAAKDTSQIIINNTTPFTSAGNRKLDRYSYQLYLAPTLRSRQHSFDLRIDSVKLNTVFQADGCCTCFENKSKLVYINGNKVPVDLTDLASNNALVPLLVTRKKTP